MFCLNEESIANHIGERCPKEKKSEILRLQTDNEEEDENPEDLEGAEDIGEAAEL
jgi:hypothetical protein